MDTPAPRSDDLGDDVEPCGCEESVALRAELTEATALLERCLDEIDCDIYDDPCTQQLVFDGQAFLASRAPALQPARREPS